MQNYIRMICHKPSRMWVDYVFKDPYASHDLGWHSVGLLWSGKFEAPLTVNWNNSATPLTLCMLIEMSCSHWSGFIFMYIQKCKRLLFGLKEKNLLVNVTLSSSQYAFITCQTDTSGQKLELYLAKRRQPGMNELWKWTVTVRAMHFDQSDRF